MTDALAQGTRPQALQVEVRSIDYVPREERHGSVRDQFTMWFGANTCGLALVFGSLAVELGLSLGWSIVAVLVGTAIGSAVTAMHAVQGPRLGVPQLIQSRGQFGFYGATVFFLGTFIMQFGYLASQLVVQGFALHQIAPSLSIPAWIVICIVPTVILAVFGYDLVHAWERYVTIALGVTAVVMLIQAATYNGHVTHPGGAWASPNFGTFMVVVALFFIAAGSWAVNVSDYSRYLPEDTRFAPTFWSIFWGIFAGWSILSVIGAVIVWAIPKGSLYANIQHMTGAWALVLLAISLIGTNTVNAYTGMLSIISFATTFFSRIRKGRTARVVGVAVVLGAALLSAVLGYSSFVNSLTNFLAVMIFIFVPWSAINLVDFYVVRKGNYDIPSFFTPQGVYGGWAGPAIVCYLIGLGAEIPFINQVWFVGPLVQPLGGVDISWIVGYIVPVILYGVVMYGRRVPVPIEAVLDPRSPEPATLTIPTDPRA